MNPADNGPMYYEDPVTLQLGDQNSWYYPANGHDSDSEELPAGSSTGNWGKKSTRGSRWVRRGKITSWGPGMDDWETDERARKRLKRMLPAERRSPSPPVLPHLRSPSPPLESPYPSPTVQHLTYSSFVLDKAVTHTFRSNLLNEIEQATNNLIEGEATMRRAMGRLWQVLSEDPDRKKDEDAVIPKREENDEVPDDEARRRARAPDLTPPIRKIFLMPQNSTTSVFEPSYFSSPESQQESLEKSLATLRDLQDDGREYVERLIEIREGLGEVHADRDGIWDMVRERAIKELQDAACSMVM
ncbi:hypothetical protein HGRIS_007591 [Hohenbuehelia grisea]|uniref:Uncharacterized protein n=1 Tax=Hohenbuehelia grisea TaxID=104357 RepID=A0ABR3J5C8_9AGAR